MHVCAMAVMRHAGIRYVCCVICMYLPGLNWCMHVSATGRAVIMYACICHWQGCDDVCISVHGL